MPIYEYYCASCETEFELLRSAPCQSCGQPAKRQLSTFSFKSDTFTSPKLGRSTQRPLRPHHREPSPEPDGDSGG